MKIKFKSTYNKKSPFRTGGFTELLDEVFNTTNAKDVKGKLSPDELSRVPIVYSSIPPDTYIPDLDNKEIFTTKNGDKLLGSDIKAITLLMYNKPRSAYTKFVGSQIAAKTCNGAVPLAMLGFKKYHNIPYSYWQKQLDGCFKVQQKKKSEDIIDILIQPADDTSIQKVFKIDMLLGKTYASTQIVGDTVDWIKDLESSWGLAALAAFSGDDYRPNVVDVQIMRDYGWGNYSGNVITSYGTKKLQHNTKTKLVKQIYNNADTGLRLMLAQRWAWYGNHRTEDMICDFQDWDNLPKSVDTESMSILAPQPKIKGVFGI